MGKVFLPSASASLSSGKVSRVFHIAEVCTFLLLSEWQYHVP
jgi:hypothetical protein